MHSFRTTFVGSVRAKVLTRERRACACKAQTFITLSASKGFCKNVIKPYIPWIWAYFLDFLAFESEAGKFWTMPLAAVLQKRKTAVEIATAHADSVHFCIECDHRSNDNIELFWGNFDTGSRFPNTELISFEPRIALNFHESHVALIFDKRHENPFFGTPCTLNNHAGVDFPCS